MGKKLGTFLFLQQLGATLFLTLMNAYTGAMPWLSGKLLLEKRENVVHCE